MNPSCTANGCYMFASHTAERAQCVKRCRLEPDPVTTTGTMRRQDQTLIDTTLGDCMRACVATITGIAIEDVPNFVDPSIPWADHMGAWLHRQGFGLIEAYADRTPKAYNWLGLEGMVAMASVPSQAFEGCTHAIVVGWRQHPEYEAALEVYVVHDPNPNNAPYEDVEKLVDGLRWIVALPKLPEVAENRVARPHPRHTGT